MGDVLQALQKHFPGLSQVVRDQYIPNAEAELKLAKDYSPKYAEVQYNNMDTWGRKLAELGRDLSAEEQRGAAKTEADVADTEGRRLNTIAKELQQEQDPEFYEQRAQQSKSLNKLESLIDPSTLTPGEQEQISRGLGRTMYGVPSGRNTIRAAQTFGDRLTRKRAEYKSLIDSRTAAMPTMRSGLEGFAAATKRSVMPNVGLGNYTGLQQPGQQQSNSVFGQTMPVANTAMGINMQKDISDWDKYAKGIGAVGDTMGVVGKLAGGIMGGIGCWIARAAFGEGSPEWIKFRTWLITKGPLWLVDWYYKYGPTVAPYVSASPFLAMCVRFVMRMILKFF